MFLSVEFTSVKYIHIVVQPISGTFSSCKTKTLYPLKKKLLISPPPPQSPGIHYSTSCFYDFDYSNTSYK